jgi:hypothetical protein
VDKYNCCRNARGFSETTWFTLNRVLKEKLKSDACGKSLCLQKFHDSSQQIEKMLSFSNIAGNNFLQNILWQYYIKVLIKI